MTDTASRNTTAALRYINPNPPPGAGLLVATNFGENSPAEMYKKSRHLMTDEKMVNFVDARSMVGGLGALQFDTHGITCFTPPPPMDSYDDEKRVKKEYYPEIVECVKRITGCKDCFIFSHLVRMPNPPNVFQNPSRFAHTDASRDSPPQWRRSLVKRYGYSEEEAQTCGVAFCNVWHPTNIAYKDPLCLLDGSTVDFANEVHPIRYVNGKGEDITDSLGAYLVGPSYSPNHRWIFISDQKPSEAYLFKQYDTRADGRAKCCFHNSFTDPHWLNDSSKPGRCSIEFRMLLTWPKKNDPLPEASETEYIKMKAKQQAAKL